MKNIMRRLFKIPMILFWFFLLLAATCEKSGDDCHRYIETINTSSNIIIYSNILYDGLSIDSCLLTRTAVLQPGQSYKQFNRSCWDKVLKLNVFDIYIVGINGLDTTGFLYCDSIEVYNDILRHYRLDETNIDSLKNVDWIIQYP